MLTPRERRLLRDFERLKALRTSWSLFHFQCADLSAAEATEFLRTKLSFDVIKNALPGFLEPSAFERQHPGAPPEKYLVIYTCKGLARADNGDIKETSLHAMEIVFGWDYPSKPPTFIWHTPIWHPNFKQPYICMQGRPFAIGLTLDQIVLEVGRMIQYQNYNVNDPLNQEAADWARQNPRRFPVDDRDLLDSRKRVGEGSGKAAPSYKLVELVPPQGVALRGPDQLIELTETAAGNQPRPKQNPT